MYHHVKKLMYTVRVDEPDVRAMCAMASVVFADNESDRIADALL